MFTRALRRWTSAGDRPRHCVRDVPFSSHRTHSRPWRPRRVWRRHPRSARFSHGAARWLRRRATSGVGGRGGSENQTNLMVPKATSFMASIIAISRPKRKRNHQPFNLCISSGYATVVSRQRTCSLFNLGGYRSFNLIWLTSRDRATVCKLTPHPGVIRFPTKV